MERKRSRKMLHYFKRGAEALMTLFFLKALKKARGLAACHSKSGKCENEAGKPRRFSRTRAFLKEKALSALKRGR